MQVDKILTVASNTLVDSQGSLVCDELTEDPLTDGTSNWSQGFSGEVIRSGREQPVLVPLWCGGVGNSKSLLAERRLVREHCDVSRGTVLCGGAGGKE